MRRILIGVSALSMLTLLGVATAPSAIAKTHSVRAVHGKKVTPHDPIIYDSIVNPSPGNLYSWAFQATQTSEFGNQITLGGASRVLNNVVVQMSSWGCQTGSGTSCVTTAGATFTEPITLNIYNVGPANAVGSLIATDTQTFAIPYRPSADPHYVTDCAPDVTQYGGNIGDYAGTWYDPTVSPVTDLPLGCFNGLLANIQFDFGHVTLPNRIIYGIAYNTSGYGSHPYGYSTACSASSAGCGYDSLNVGLSNEPGSPTIGSDPNLGTAYLNTITKDWYCDDGAGEPGRFASRADPTPTIAGMGAEAIQGGV